MTRRRTTGKPTPLHANRKRNRHPSERWDPFFSWLENAGQPTMINHSLGDLPGKADSFEKQMDPSVRWDDDLVESIVPFPGVPEAVFSPASGSSAPSLP